MSPFLGDEMTNVDDECSIENEHLDVSSQLQLIH